MPTRKVLLLTCNTGQGHNTAASAIAAYLEKQGIPAVIRDALAFISPGFSDFISRSQTCLYRHAPALFDWGWQKSLDHLGMFDCGTMWYRVLARGQEHLLAHLIDGGYTTVVCTHAIPAVMMTDLLSHHPLPIETAFIATDYTVYPSMESTAVDACFLPTPSVSPPFIARGVAPASIRFASIPIGSRHFAQPDRATACRTLGLDATRRQLLIMTGSVGCGPLSAIVADLAADPPPHTEITVICGTNHGLQRKLVRRCRDIPAIHIVGYTEDIPLYMSVADLMLTKPGGISITEAAVHRVPMVLVSAVAGCEADNRAYLLSLGVATSADTPMALADECRHLLADDGERRRMVAAFSRGNFGDGAAVIGQAIQNGLKKAARATSDEIALCCSLPSASPPLRQT